MLKVVYNEVIVFEKPKTQFEIFSPINKTFIQAKDFH